VYKLAAPAVISGVAAFALGAPLVADVASAQSQTADGPIEIEEVLVTARKREESLQDVPLSVTALSAGRIEELRILSPDDIARFTPGFSYTSSFGRSGGERPTIRGQTNIIGAANASFFVDGVYVSGTSLSTETSNLERIEVIKGPQAALYGRATFAGAINYITKRPTNELTGRISLTAAQHGETEASGFVSGPIVEDKLRYYVGVRLWKYDGDYTNEFDQTDAAQQKTNSGTAKLLWTPTENFEATVLATIAKDDDPGALALGLQGREFNNCRLRVVNGTSANNFAGTILPRSPGYQCGEVLSAGDLRINQRSDVFPDQGSRRDDQRFALTTKTSFGGGYELTTVTGYHEEDGASQSDQSYDAYDAFTNLFGASQVGAFWGGSSYEREDFQQEIRLDSPQQSRLRWRVGAYYFKGNRDDLTNKKYIPPNTAVLPTNCVRLSSGHIECPQSTVEPLAETTLENRALFGEVDFDITDKFTVTAEVRRAKEESEQINGQAIPRTTSCFITTNTGASIDTCRFAGEWTSTTPRFTFRYEATPDATYYLNAAKGTKPGGFNTANAVQVGINTNVPVKAVYDEEESKAYELGAKFNLLDRRANLNVAAFWTKLTGQQLTSNIVGVLNGAAAVNSFIANVGETEIKGLELDGNLLITDRWDAQATFSYVDSKLKSFFDNNQVNLTSPTGTITTAAGSTTGPVLTCTNGPATSSMPNCAAAIAADLAQYGSVAGNYSPRTPKIQASLSSSYKGAFSNGLSWRLSGDVSYEGSKYGQVDNLNKTPAHTYLGLRYTLSTENWDVTLWGKNLTDDDGTLDILRYVDTRGITPATYGTPQFGRITPRGFVLTLPRSRQIGVTAAYRF